MAAVHVLHEQPVMNNYCQMMQYFTHRAAHLHTQLLSAGMYGYCFLPAFYIEHISKAADAATISAANAH